MDITSSSPDIMDITSSSLTSSVLEVVESLPCEMDKIEFPNPEIASENQMMVSEYFGIPNNNSFVVASDSSEKFARAALESIQLELQKIDSPSTSVSNSTNRVSSSVSSETSDAPLIVKSPDEEHDSKITVNLEMEQKKVVQQDLVDMYMKSMQQFTESLAKMKLPLNIVETETTSPGNSSSNPKNSGPRLFYGSRAFF